MDVDIKHNIPDSGKTANGGLVYIASPYSGDVERNTGFARAACRYCIEQGCTPVAPHLLYPQILDDMIPEQRKTGLRLGFHLLSVCDEMWICGSSITPGMSAEIAEAERHGIPVRQIPAEQILNIPDTEYKVSMG